MHTYIAFRVAPAILIAFLFILIISKKTIFSKTYWKPLTVYLIFDAHRRASDASWLLYSTPNILKPALNPFQFFLPKSTRDILDTLLWVSVTKTLGMFNFQGDMNWRHNFPGQPELQFFVGIFFLIGIFYLFGHFFYLLYHRFKYGKHNDELVIATLILAWFFVMLLPEMLTYEGLASFTAGHRLSSGRHSHCRFRD